ncbi:MAG: GAF domain-containing protein [Chloroflexota bacterium]
MSESVRTPSDNPSASLRQITPVRQRGSLFYKILPIFILLSLVPTLLTSARLLNLNDRLLRAGGGDPVSGTAWNLPANAVVEINRTLAVEAGTYLVYTFLTIAIIAIFASGGIIQPLRKLENLIEAFRRTGKLATDISGEGIAGGGGTASTEEIVPEDEVDALTISFSHLAQDLVALQGDMAAQITQRTRALERRAAQLQAAASVAQVTVSIRDMDQLLNQSCELISQNFGYYHTGIFLLDMTHENAVLRAANSTGGTQMLERGHKLPLGETSIVGHVASTRQPRVASNVGADVVHFRNPFLPDTRSEMALPLVTGIGSGSEQSARMWGVLDVQSTSENAFSQDDIATLQIVANQLAVAIENANLFIENQANLEELRATLDMSRKVYGELSQDAWRKLLQSRPGMGYLCKAETGAHISAGASGDATVASAQHLGAQYLGRADDLPIQPSMQRVISTGKALHPDDTTLVLPIQIRQQTVGVVRLRKDNDAPSWSESEIELLQTLSEQLSVALESARLFEETRRRAERERLTAEITAKVRSSDDPQVILQTAVSELRRALQASRAQALIVETKPVAPPETHTHTNTSPGETQVE